MKKYIYVYAIIGASMAGCLTVQGQSGSSSMFLHVLQKYFPNVVTKVETLQIPKLPADLVWNPPTPMAWSSANGGSCVKPSPEQPLVTWNNYQYLCWIANNWYLNNEGSNCVGSIPFTAHDQQAIFSNTPSFNYQNCNSGDAVTNFCCNINSNQASSAQAVSGLTGNSAGLEQFFARTHFSTLSNYFGMNNECTDNNTMYWNCWQAYNPNYAGLDGWKIQINIIQKIINTIQYAMKLALEFLLKNPTLSGTQVGSLLTYMRSQYPFIGQVCSNNFLSASNGTSHQLLVCPSSGTHIDGYYNTIIPALETLASEYSTPENKQMAAITIFVQGGALLNHLGNEYKNLVSLETSTIQFEQAEIPPAHWEKCTTSECTQAAQELLSNVVDLQQGFEKGSQVSIYTNTNPNVNGNPDCVCNFVCSTLNLIPLQATQYDNGPGIVCACTQLPNENNNLCMYLGNPTPVCTHLNGGQFCFNPPTVGGYQPPQVCIPGQPSVGAGGVHINTFNTKYGDNMTKYCPSSLELEVESLQGGA